MSVGSISGQSNSLLVYFQSLQNSGVTGVQPASANPASCMPLTSADGSISGDTTGGAQGTSAGGAASSGTLLQQLQSAIQNALTGLDPSQSNSPGDIFQAISQAIGNTLQSDGIAPNKLHGHGHHHHHAAGGSADNTSSGSAPPAGTDASSTGTGTVPPAGGATTSTQGEGLDSLINQLNVDAQQFKTDLLSALSSLQSGVSGTGSIDLGQVFQTIPSGQAVNAVV